MICKYVALAIALWGSGLIVDSLTSRVALKAEGGASDAWRYPIASAAWAVFFAL